MWNVQNFWMFMFVSLVFLLVLGYPMGNQTGFSALFNLPVEHLHENGVFIEIKYRSDRSNYVTSVAHTALSLGYQIEIVYGDII